MFALRARRKVITEKDFLDAVQKVVSSAELFCFTLLLFDFPGEGICQV
jgi:ATP-dependent 26S proteasome regulatory subunit